MNNILSRTNVIILLIGIAALVVGYIALSRGPADNPLSLSVAPVILVIAYCVIIPIAFFKKNKVDPEKDPGKK